jgi:predicted ATPase
LMVLNEPETSLHPDLFPALARLIARAAKHSQLIVVSHSLELIGELTKQSMCHSIRLEKQFGETTILEAAGCESLVWQWPGR